MASRHTDWLLGYRLGHLDGLRNSAPVWLGPGGKNARAKKPAPSDAFWSGYQTGYADGGADRRVASATKRARIKRRTPPISHALAVRCPSRSARGFHCTRSTHHKGVHRNRRWSWKLSGHAERLLSTGDRP